MHGGEYQHLQYHQYLVHQQQMLQQQIQQNHNVLPPAPATPESHTLAYLHQAQQSSPFPQHALSSPSPSLSSPAPSSTTTPSTPLGAALQHQRYASPLRELDNDGVVGAALKILHQALHEFADKMFTRYLGEGWVPVVLDRLRSSQPMHGVASTTFGQVAKEIADGQKRHAVASGGGVVEKELDLRDLLLCVTRMWDIFRTVFKPDVRSLCFELTGVRNRWAHQDTFTISDTYRALDTIERVLSAMGAVEQMQAVKLDREGYAVYMGERLKQQGTTALPIRDQPTASWCGSRASSRSYSYAPTPSSSAASTTSSSPMPPPPSPAATRGVQLSAAQVEQEFGMDWEL